MCILGRPRHKLACTRTPDGLFKNFHKICQTFIANDLFLWALRVLISLELKLAKTQDLQQRFSVQVFMHFEPVDDGDFLDTILSHVPIDASPVLGMLQVGAISSTPIYEDTEGMTMLPPPTNPAQSQGALLQLDEQESLPFVRVQFLRILPSGGCQSMTTGVFITPQAIESSRKARVIFLPLRRAESEAVPVSVESYRE